VPQLISLSKLFGYENVPFGILLLILLLLLLFFFFFFLLLLLLLLLFSFINSRGTQLLEEFEEFKDEC
jgi:hypothetical protein